MVTYTQRGFMDLRTFLFNSGISAARFAKAVGMDLRTLWRVVDREIRPRSDRAYIIEALTGGAVTVDELVNPAKYPVEWAGDLARQFNRRILLKEPDVESMCRAIERMGVALKEVRKRRGKKMDAKIKAISKGVKKTEKGLKKLLKEDHKRDPACHLGEKIIAKKKGKK